MELKSELKKKKHFFKGMKYNLANFGRSQQMFLGEFSDFRELAWLDRVYSMCKVKTYGT